MAKKIQKLAEKRFKFKIITSMVNGKLHTEFAWEPDQGLGTSCHAAADALLTGKAAESGEWSDPVKADHQEINNQQSEGADQYMQQGF